MKSISIFLVMFLTACSSTKKSVTDQATHGVSLISQLEIELAEFRRLETLSERNLIDSIKGMKNSAVELDSNIVLDAIAVKAVGDVDTLKIADNLNQMLDEIALKKGSEISSKKIINKELNNLLTALPSTVKYTSEAQAKLAEFNKDLSFSTKATELEALIESVQKNVSDNKKKIDEAEKAQ